MVIRRIGCTKYISSSHGFIMFSSFSAVFKLAGWSKRAIIARGSQWVSKDLVAISLSLANGGVDTAENEPKVDRGGDRES